MVIIKIMEAKVKDTGKLAKLFNAMLYSVTTLTIDMFNNLPFAPTPLKGLRITKYYCFNEHTKCVFEANGKNYKFYDTTDLLFPNIEIIKMLGEQYLPEMQVCNLTECQRFRMFSYKFMYNNGPNSLQSFIPIMKALDDLHHNSIVHSDVQYENLLFLDGDAKLMDFDLADEVGTFYPPTFNEQLRGRHTGANSTHFFTLQMHRG